MTPQPEQPTTPALANLPCACSNLRRATRAVSQLYAQEMRRVGLEGTQFSLLMVLSKAGGVTQSRLAGLLAIDSTTLTRTLGRLRRRGWVRATPGRDQRERRLELTRAGLRQLERGLPQWQRAQQRLREALGEESWNRLFRVAVEVTRAAQAA